MASPSASSFVTAVLATAGRLDKDDLNTKLGQLSRKIDEVKLEVHDALNKKYVEFYPLFDSTRQLRSRVGAVQSEMEAMLMTIEKQLKAQLQISAGDYEMLQSKYDESKTALAILKRLLDVNEGFQSVEQHAASKNYVEATRALGIVKKTIDELKSTYGDQLKVLSCLIIHYVSLAEKLETSVLRHWHGVVQWKTLPETKKTCNVDLWISEATDEIALSAQSLNNLDRLGDVMSRFSEKFMRDFFRKLLETRGAHLSVKKEEGFSMISVVCNSTEHDADNTVIDTVHQIKMMISVIHMALLKVRVVDSELHSRSLMSLVGSQVANEFIDAFIKDCLSRSIPSSHAGLASFNDVIISVEDLEQKLVELEFITGSERTLNNYVNNVEVLFSSKRCQEILESARSLMTSELHNIIDVSDEDRGIKVVETLALKQGDSGTNTKKSKLTTSVPSGVTLDSLFAFPQCRISIAAQKLVRMGYDVLKEATEDADVPIQTAVQLFYCVRAMFEMFASIVPVYHRERLTTVPQMAAIHHNDCMFIAHHLMLLGLQFKSGLPEPLRSGAATFVDLIPVLRRPGTRCFLEQLSTQKTQILQSLNSAHSFVGLSNPDNFEAAERAVGQVLLQLRHLVNVWKDVLPCHVYAKSIGTLLNTAVSELILYIVNLDDIRELESDLIASLLNDLNDSAQSEILAPVMEKHPVAVVKLVPAWGRLAETKFLLKARMQDIVDRWADGKGPLAAEFKATEVKQMIRALFQNTDKRAAALSAIN